MPELPEVEAARALARRVAVGRRVTTVWAADDPIVFEGVTPDGLRRALLGRRVVAARRHGKHLWLELDRRPWPTFHFGMSGGLYAPRRGVWLVAHGERDPRTDWPPRFAKLRLGFEDGGELVFADPRRLGRIRLRRDPRREPPIAGLGFDAFRELPPPDRFEALLAGRSAPVKTLLLDQSFAAGVGNWVADEVLYQARIDPRRPARSLSPAEGRRLRAALRRVLATAVRAGADSERYPSGWLFHVRWDRTALAAGARPIRRLTIGGRTAAWVPAVQR